MILRLFVLFLMTLTVLAEEALPKPEPVVTAHAYKLKSQVLDQTRVLNVYLPPGYEDSQERFPVLVLLDGGVREDFIHVMGLASLAADYRKIRPFILVGIENVDRYHDFLPKTEVPQELEWWPTAGGSDDFRVFLKDELVPFIKKQFRTSEELVLMGESAAGRMVVDTFLNNTDLFHAYIAVSPSLWWNQLTLPKSAPESLKQCPYPSNRRLFLTIADEGGEMQEGMDLLVKALKEHAPTDLTWFYQPMPEENHATIFHPAALKAVRTIFVTEEKKETPAE